METKRSIGVWIAWLSLCVVPLIPAAEPVVDGIVLTLVEQADLAAREPGILLKIAAREGTFVEAGQLLGQLDDTDARHRLAKAELEWTKATREAESPLKMRFAEKAVEVAEAELRRAEESVAKFDRSISETELDRLRLLAEKSRLELEQATLDQELAGLIRDLKARDRDLAAYSCASRQLTAPFAGMVVSWKVRPGEWVDPAAAVVRVIRLSSLRAEGFIDARSLTLDDVGRKVGFTATEPADTTRDYEGEIAFVSPEIDPVNGQVRFWAEIDNTARRLRPGTLGRLTLLPTTDPPTGAP